MTGTGAHTSKTANSRNVAKFFDDIFQEFLSGTSIPKNAPFQKPYWHVWTSGIRALKNFLTGGLKHNYFNREALTQPEEEAVWFYSATDNQHHAVFPIMEEMDVVYHDMFGIHPAEIWGRDLWFSALMRLPKAMVYLLIQPTKTLKTLAGQAELLSIMLAEKEAFRKAVRRSRPLALVMSNDHSPRNRNIIRAARDCLIPVIYVQHAAVGGIERPLTDFVMALLHGQHSLDIYQTLGDITAEVHLIGSPKIDYVLASKIDGKEEYRDQNKETRIGIFPGLFDDISKVRELAEMISEVSNAKLGIKLHPRDLRRAEWSDQLAGLADIQPEVVTAYSEFLSSCDLIIFDDSSIGLEACALSVPVIRYQFTDQENDQYQVQSTGIFEDCQASKRSIRQQIERALSGKTECQTEKVRYFFSNYKTEDHGRSHSVAAKIIANYVRKGVEP